VCKVFLSALRDWMVVYCVDWWWFLSRIMSVWGNCNITIH